MHIKNLIFPALAAASLASMGACNSDKSANNREVSVMQFNVWQEGTVIPGGFEAIANEIARLKPDFVTLSEVRNYNDSRFCDRIVEALRERGLDYYSFYSYDSGLLSRYPLTDSATVFPHANDHGTIYRLNTEIDGVPFAVYTAHLDYLNDTYYEVRGYDGNNWSRMDAPLTDIDTILYRNSLSQRDEAIDSFINDAARQRAAGATVILGGDFNEPSWQDWTEATCDSADHHGVVIEWPNTSRLHQAGYSDAYRQIFPDPVEYPGYTYPSYNRDHPCEKLSWTPESDERERIDYIYFYPDSGRVSATEAFIVGPRDLVVRSIRHTNTSSDSILEPLDVWPTDHKALFVRLKY